MFDSKQVKSSGLQFARALQVAIKTASVFPVEHKSSERPIQQSYDFLAKVMSGVGQFTFGFVDNQVMLNKVLTVDPSLKPLEAEFTKRGIAAITFEPGLALPAYKKLIYLFAAPPASMEATGGFIPYLNHNPIEGLHIVPAKKQNKNEQGDTIIETDSESYILGRQRGEEKAPRDFLDSIDALLESGCFDSATRAEALSNFAASSMDGSGYGIPIDVPKLEVVRDGEAVLPATAQVGGSGAGSGFGPGVGPGGGSGPGGSVGKQAMAAAAGQGAGGVGAFVRGETGAGPVNAIASGSGTETVGGILVAQSSGIAGESGIDSTAYPALGRLVRRNSGPDTFLQFVEQAVQRSLAEEKGNPQKSLLSLARLLQNTGVDKILQRFPAENHEELRQLKPEQLAAEYMQNTALQLAGTKLQAAHESSKLEVEEEVLHLLARSLEATHMADRLALKLAKFVQDFAIPPHVQLKIREELQWTSLNSTKKFTKLMELKRYSNLEFRRFVELGKELLAQGNVNDAGTLVNHYFEFLDDPEVRIESAELSRVPEIVEAFAAANAAFKAKTAERLGRVLLREDVSEFIHFQAANGLGVIGQSLVSHEDFPAVASLGLLLEKSSTRDQEKHAKCCGPRLAALLPDNALERIIEIYLQKRSESGWARTTLTLLRFSAPGSIHHVIDHLVSETDARNRLALVRLAGQLGSGSIEVAVKYLADERWYVVRNMCSVLAELSDPHLVEHIAPALRHSDARVQQAALKALVKSRGAKTAQALGAALPTLSPHVLDETLDELMYMKSPHTISALEDFVASGKCNLVRANKAIQALGGIADVAALYSLGRLFRIEELDTKVRRAALTAISNHSSAVATRLLEELSTSWGPLAEEARKELDKRAAKPD